MRRWFAYFLRAAAIVAGFIGASVAAAAFIALLIAGGLDWSGDGHDVATAGIILATIALSALYGSLAFIPAMLLIAYAEIAERRSWLFHALAGGAVAIAVYALRPGRDGLAMPDADLLASGVAAGCVGGLVYWLIAGRRSGQVMTDVAGGRYSDQSTGG